jgi:hypothetical protein
MTRVTPRRPRATASPFSARSFAWIGAAVGTMLAVTASAATTPALASEAFAFTDKYCTTCHNDIDKEGGLDLTSLVYAPENQENFLLWVRVHDRVQAGEMPPKEKKRPEAGDVRAFVQSLTTSLTADERALTAREGRVTQRRLNRYEYENALRDLLQAPWLQVRAQLPEDGEAHRFNKVSQALDVSHVHMARYMLAAEYAMKQAMSVQLFRPPTTLKRYYAREEPTLTGRYQLRELQTWPDRATTPILGTKAQPDVRFGKAPPTVGDTDPARRDQEAVGMVQSTYTVGFGYSWSNFMAPIAAKYRVRFSGYTIWVGSGASRRVWEGTGAKKAPVDRPKQWERPNLDDVSPGRRGEAITVYAQGPGLKRRIGAFDLTTEPTVSEFEVQLLTNETLLTDAARLFRSRPDDFTNPLAQRDGMPGVAFRWIEVEGPLYDESTGAGYRLMFGDLPLRQDESSRLAMQAAAAAAPGRGRGGRRGTLAAPDPVYEVVSQNPSADAERLLRGFIARAYRRPVEETDVRRFLNLFEAQRADGSNFTEAMFTMYTAVLASPGFVFIDEPTGPLDDHSLATRLAFFLWNSEPDAALRTRAARGELHRPEVLQAETERMLSDPKSKRFVEAFLDYWIDIRKMEDTTPSGALYNDYDLDDSLTEAAWEETQLYFSEMLRANLPARTIVDSDFTFLNERLATHYGIPGFAGGTMRRVTLPSGSVRGGIMTQASVLKVTANGTTTSPVLRGKWIMERILGRPAPLPPAAVPAVEPDIRGAVTIRQQLERHRADESCAVCHRKIDPPGFALESFDVMGGWRDRYRATSPQVLPTPGFGKNGHPFAFHYALPVDASGQLLDGREFKDVREFKQLLLTDEAQLARNLAEQLVVFATGAPVRFSDRPQIETILETARSQQYGARSLVHAIVTSALFRNK